MLIWGSLVGQSGRQAAQRSLPVQVQHAMVALHSVATGIAGATSTGHISLGMGAAVANFTAGHTAIRAIHYPTSIPGRVVRAIPRLIQRMRGN